MKNIFFLLAFICSQSASGQNKEAYVNYGTHFLNFNNDDINGNFSNTTRWPIDYKKPGRLNVPTGQRSYVSSSGIFTAGYNVRKGKSTIGVLFQYEKQMMSHRTNLFRGDTIQVNTNGQINNVPLGVELIGQIAFSDSFINNYHVAFRYDYNWIFQQNLKVYTGASLGLALRRSNTIYFDVDSIRDDYPDENLESFLRDKSSEYNYHFHLNLLGLRFGNVWAVVAEFGLGHRGYVNVGINHLLFASEKWETKRQARAQ